MSETGRVPEVVSRACTEGAGTVQALAEEVGVSYAALCSWSRGRRQPPAHRLRKLAEVLDNRAERLRLIAAELRGMAGEAAPRAQPVVEAEPRLIGSRLPSSLRPSASQRPELDRAASPRRSVAPGIEAISATHDRAAAAVDLLMQRPR